MTRDAQLQALHRRMRACAACHREGHPVEPPPVTHLGPASPIMVVAQAPGALERHVGKPFQGASGRRLDEWFARAGLPDGSWRGRLFTTSVTKCYPGKDPNKGDRAPSRAEVALCAPWLDAQLGLVAPEVVVPAGRMAIERFLGRNPGTLKELVGRRFDAGERVVIPLPHPSPASLWLNKAENQALLHEALALVGEQVERFGLATG